jgi:hypothetical protein
MAKRLTVSYLEDRPRDAVFSGTPRDCTVPYLRMRGRWLRRLGFTIGTKLAVEAEPGRLVLTVLPSPSLSNSTSPAPVAASDVCEAPPED